MIRPTLAKARELAADFTVLPVALELFSDVKTPIEVLRSIRRQSTSWFILESINGNDSWGRYSFLGYRPVRTVFGTGNKITVQENGFEKTQTGNPVESIRKMIAEYKSPRISELPPFTGGFVGYFAYDFVQQFIPGLQLGAADQEGFSDFHLMLMDKVIAFDHFKQKIFIIVNVPTKNLEEAYISGVTELKNIEKMILEILHQPDEKETHCGSFFPAFPKEKFAEMVCTVQNHIREGDIFQAVISNRFQADFKGSLLNVYRRLRTINPSPYMVYMRLGDMEIACASPETLVALRDGQVSAFPLAGTCPRGGSKEKDAALEKALLQDEKELAEHDMLVDLARNDVGRVSRFGTVQVSEYRQIKRFSHVSHISSHVTGMLKEGMDAMDVIGAALPAGTLSGAPKKRACEIIDSVEGMRRGAYGGAIGYIDFAGNMDMCIGIRMAVLKDETVYVQSGAGIVADSVPEKEYAETQNKARAVMEALQNLGEV